MITTTNSSTSNSSSLAGALSVNMSIIEEDSVNLTTTTLTTDEPFPPHVDATNIVINPESPSSKKQSLKTFNEVNTLIQGNRKRDVKIILRENAWPLNNGIRAHLWPALCQQHTSAKNIFTKAEDGFYWAMVTSLFGTVGKNDNDSNHYRDSVVSSLTGGAIAFPANPTPSQIVQLIEEKLSEKSIVLPSFVDSSHCLSYNLTGKGRNIADRVVSVLGFSCPDITYSPTLYPFTALLLHFMTEEDCYHCMASLVACKDKVFVTQTKLLFEVTWKTVEQIAKKYVKSAAAHLSRHSGMRGDRIYSDWIWWILQLLPFQHIVRVMDCFLHEGSKVFYRISMAILLLFYKHSSSQSSEWMQEIVKHGLDTALSKFCRQIPVSPAKLLRIAFGIRGLTSAYISKVFLRTELTLKSRTVLTGSRSLARSRSSDNLPTSQSQVNIQMMSHTLTIREGSHSPEPRSYAMGAYPIQGIKSLVIEEDENLFTLWSWLPVRITMYQPTLLYTTEEHGCSLTTFYLRVEQHEPTLLMIKTCNNEVFGAYCSTRWCERNMKDDKGHRQAYFGTGETFLFSLYPERAKYPWVGMDSTHNDIKVHHSAELFMAADSKMITIGGGDGQAIWMDENIRYGKTDHCSTFNNPPLCASGDFEIRVLEVYGFSGA
ncbi:GTPase-activating protein skywalker isoform X1 [Cotesia glomerata]|uniref:GTPase-activating protein skywalker isoform X1 n=1 Tax=Cotesia glomerata TaxID=32391 RepID=UPI001D00D947|nr:GTPase-activating protein skywalker isoform X1 [Cotesia glomerata]XP_044594754.1 GTPase-activating protein skywalker isoform X1 [Cotesia glomerata]XP_044594755.1 GTPase-activating protein skywalker isoform X1 [Cotesia glomerata]XP_044594756.1 GTPase-activating protein skywalker isoform X1 [Cotesia glomerata]XP_044594757.1 GTPase-activating protein skywalker isoform X1 [Cotesia glomerata]